MDYAFLMWILFVIHRASATLPTWNMHSVCGRTISQTDKGGFLVFNSFLLPASYKMDCSVVIQPAPTESSTTSGHYVLFHFSNFTVGKSCQHSNVTVTDGNGINMKPVEGLKSPMCGRNSSLSKDVTFRTQSFYITVLFQSDATGSNFLSKFNMTFLSFSEGSCGSDNQDLFTCSNDRCIDKKFTCLNLNPCGDNSDCSSKEALSDDYTTMIQYITIAVMSVLSFCIFCTFVMCFQSNRGCCECCSELCDCECECCSDLCEFCCECWGNILVACRRCCRDLFTACRRCSCFRSLVGGVLDACRRLKTNLTSAQQSEGPRVDSDVEDPDPITQSTNTFLQDGRRARNRSRSSLSSASSSEHSRSNSIVSVDSEAIGACGDIGATGRHPDAPPSYQEVASSRTHVRPKHRAPSAPSIPSAPPALPEIAAPPSYEEVIANITKYVNNKVSF